MESYNHINIMFDDMIDDIKYIKFATFARKVQRQFFYTQFKLTNLYFFESFYIGMRGEAYVPRQNLAYW